MNTDGTALAQRRVMGLRKFPVRRALAQAGQTRGTGSVGKKRCRENDETQPHGECEQDKRHERMALLPEDLQMGAAGSHASAIG